MKTILSIFVLFNFAVAHADCDAPALDLNSMQTELHGFKVIKVWDDTLNKVEPNDTSIHFGDYSFIFRPVSSKLKPKEIKIDPSDFTKKLSKLFKSSPHYLDKVKQEFKIISTKGIELAGKGSVDILLFEVTSGANVYSGAIGITKGEWVEIIKPSCY